MVFPFLRNLVTNCEVRSLCKQDAPFPSINSVVTLPFLTSLNIPFVVLLLLYWCLQEDLTRSLFFCPSSVVSFHWRNRLFSFFLPGSFNLNPSPPLSPPPLVIKFLPFHFCVCSELILLFWQFRGPLLLP